MAADYPGGIALFRIRDLDRDRDRLDRLQREVAP